MRALAVLGLGKAHDGASAADIAEIARAVDAGALARAAAAYALGELDAQASRRSLVAIAEDGDTLPRRMALVALARMARAAGAKEPDWKREAVQAMADAVFVGSGDASARSSTVRGALRHRRGGALVLAGRGGPDAGGPEVASSALDAAPDGRPGRRRAPRPARAREARPTPTGRGARRVRRSDQRARALRAAHLRPRAHGGARRARAPGRGSFCPSSGRAQTGPAADAARAIATALAPSVVPLASNPDPGDPHEGDRARRALGGRRGGRARSSRALAGLEREPCSGSRSRPSARRARAGTSSPATSAPWRRSGRILATHESWAMRVLAAQALGRARRRRGDGAPARTLADAAAKDSYALVREAALEALASFDAARRAGRRAAMLAATDPEPRVREAATALAR